MFQAVLLICSIAVAVEDCQRQTATQVVVAPEEQSTLAGCSVYGIEYAAQSGLLTDEHYYPKIRCEGSR